MAQEIPPLKSGASQAPDALCVTPLEREQWRSLAHQFHDYNYRHIWDYGVALAQIRGADCEHVAITRNGDTLALADVRIKHIPIIGGGMAYVSGGPLVRRHESEELEYLQPALRALKEEYALRRRLILRVMLPIWPNKSNMQVTEYVAAAGFQTTTRSAKYRTFLVDLARPLHEIRKSFGQKWRNCLNNAERQGLEVSVGNSVHDMELFQSLFDEFVIRKGFYVELGATFYTQLQRQIDDERLVVSLARLNGKVIAGHVASILGDTSVYLLGATDEEALKRKAAYLLQWQAIITAHEHGCRWYDLGGIDPAENPNVHRFKEGLGGGDMCGAGPFEYASLNLKTIVAGFAERFYMATRRRIVQL